MSNIGPPYQTLPNAWATATISAGTFTSVDGALAKLSRTNTGVFVFTLDATMAVAANAYELSVVWGAASTTAGPAAYFVADTSNVVKTITFKDLLNAACDVTFLTVGMRLLVRN